jgi:hypothetical protein
MKLIKWLLTAFTLIFASVSSAKMLTLYDQPKTDAKTVSTIDSEAGIIPIFSPKNSEWIKVADPKNGNVGWIKSAELTAGNESGFSFSQKFISNGKGPQSYIIQFGTPKMLSPEESQAFAKRLQEQTQAIQKQTQKMMQDMYKNMDALDMPYPVVMPIIVMPNTNAAQSNKTENKAAADKVQ